MCAGRLLAVEWIAPRTAARRARLAFVFAGPVLSPHTRIRLQEEELEAWRWETPGRALVLLHHRIAARLAPRPHRPRPPHYSETERLHSDD